MLGTNASMVTTAAADNDVHTIKIVGMASNNREYLYLDGTLLAAVTTSSQGMSANTLSYYIFARHRSSGYDNASYFRVMSAKFTMHNVTAEFIPVRKNGVGYLFDKESQTLHGNANSSGAFTYGNDV